MDAKEKESRVGGTDFGWMGCFGGWVVLLEGGFGFLDEPSPVVID